jgi:hypothetical protein
VCEEKVCEEKVCKEKVCAHLCGGGALVDAGHEQTTQVVRLV